MSVAITFTDDELAAIGIQASKEYRDMQHGAIPLVDDLRSALRKKVTGSRRFTVNWEVDDHAQVQQLTSGWEQLVNTVSPTLTVGHDVFGRWVIVVAMSGKEMDEYPTSVAQLDLWKQRQQNVRAAFEHRMSQRIWGLAAGNVMSSLNSLNGDDVTGGFLQHDAIGSQTEIVHNVTKTTFTAAQIGFQNQIGDMNGSFFTNGLDVIDQARAARDSIITRTKETSGGNIQLSDRVAGYISQSCQPLLSKATRAFERYDDANGHGQPITMWAGVKHKIARNMPNAGGDTGADPWSIVWVDLDNMLVPRFLKYLAPTAVREPSGYDLKAQYLISHGQFEAKFWGTSALMFDGEV